MNSAAHISHVEFALSILLSLITWPLYLVLWILLFLPGVPVVYVLANKRAWEWRKSRYYRTRVDDGVVIDQISVWKYRWAWIWGNEEDGVIGAPFWLARNKTLPINKVAFRWSALRNPINNLRFVPLLNPVINPKRIRYRCNSLNPGDSREHLIAAIGHDKIFRYWSFTRQGLYTGWWYIRNNGDGTHFRIRLGWKLLPQDRYGVLDSDYRKPRCGFAIQFTPKRKG